MPVSFGELCNEIRNKIELKEKGTIKAIKDKLELTDLNTIDKNNLKSKVSKVKSDDSTLIYAGILIEIVMFYSKSKELSTLIKYIERLKNYKLMLVDTVKILNKLGLKKSDFYKTVTDKEAYKNICEIAKNLLKKVTTEDLINKAGINDNDKVKERIEKEQEFKVTEASFEAKNLEELLQILANIKATCKDGTIGDAETLKEELNLLLPNQSIENLKEEINYLRLAINENKGNENTKKLEEQLGKCHDEIKIKLTKTKDKIIGRLGILEMPPKPEVNITQASYGKNRQMFMNLNAIKAAQRKNLALAQKINTAYHEATTESENDISKITSSILEKIKDTIGITEVLSYYAGIYTPKNNPKKITYLKAIEKCEIHSAKVEEAITKYAENMIKSNPTDQHNITMLIMSKNIQKPVVFTSIQIGDDNEYKNAIKTLLFSKEKLPSCTVIPVQCSNDRNNSYDPEALENAAHEINALADDLNEIFQSNESNILDNLKEAYNKHTMQRKLIFREGHIHSDYKNKIFQAKTIYESTAEKVLEDYAKSKSAANPEQKLLITKFIISSIVPRVAFVYNKQTNDFIDNVQLRLYGKLTREQKKKRDQNSHKATWTNGEKPTMGGHREANQHQNAAPDQAQPRPQPTQMQQMPHPTAQMPQSQPIQTPIYQQSQQQMPQQQAYPPDNPIMQQQAQPAMPQTYAQQTTQPQTMQQMPGGQPQYIQTPGQAPQYSQQNYAQQPMYQQYYNQTQQYPPQQMPQQFYPNQRQTAYPQQTIYQQPTYAYPQRPATQQQPQQQSQNTQPTQQPQNLTEKDEKKLKLKEELQNKLIGTKNDLKKLKSEALETQRDVIKLGSRINQLAKINSLDDNTQRNYLYSTGKYLDETLNKLKAIHTSAKEHNKKFEGMHIYFVDLQTLETNLKKIEGTTKWTELSLSEMEKLKTALDEITTTLNTNYGQPQAEGTASAEGQSDSTLIDNQAEEYKTPGRKPEDDDVEEDESHEEGETGGDGENRHIEESDDDTK